jgi:hypothetical protein
MEKTYKQAVDEMGLFGEGICHICGKPGYHEACEKRELEIAKKFKNNDQLFIKRYAVHNKYGVTESSKSSYHNAFSILDSFLSRQDLKFEKDQVVEGDRWWFFPNDWIGLIGFIVEKETGKIYPLGSGLAGYDKKYHFVPAHWVAIDKYLNGSVESVKVHIRHPLNPK